MESVCSLYQNGAHNSIDIKYRCAQVFPTCNSRSVNAALSPPISFTVKLLLVHSRATGPATQLPQQSYVDPGDALHACIVFATHHARDFRPRPEGLTGEDSPACDFFIGFGVVSRLLPFSGS